MAGPSDHHSSDVERVVEPIVQRATERSEELVKRVVEAAVERVVESIVQRATERVTKSVLDVLTSESFIDEIAKRIAFHGHAVSQQRGEDCKGGTKRKRIKEESASNSATAEESDSDQMVKLCQQCLFFRVLRDYRDGKLDNHFYDHKRDYSKGSFWVILSYVFDERAKDDGIDPIPICDIIMFGNKLENDFVKERNRGLDCITPRLSEIFSPCDDCQRKIPTFPKSLGKELGYRAPTRSRSTSAFGSGSGSGFGASMETAGKSHIAEILYPHHQLVDRIRQCQVQNEITLSEMMKLLVVVNKWKENTGWMSLLLSAKTSDQFVENMKVVLDQIAEIDQAKEQEQQSAMLKQEQEQEQEQQSSRSS